MYNAGEEPRVGGDLLVLGDQEKLRGGGVSSVGRA